jgi:hypothetical protein
VPPQKHELLYLFGQLEPAQQSRMEELYNLQAQSDRAFTDLQASEPGTPFTLVYALTEMNKTFETWRYAYELPYETSLLGHPWKAAGRLILEIKPQWVAIAARLDIPPTFPDR